MNRRHRQRGTAILEFVLCIPLLALLIAATFFFGWAMRNQQRMRTADRFAGWRAVEASEPTAEQLNVMFFAGRGRDIRLFSDSGPLETLEAWAASADEHSDAGGRLVEELLDKELLPRGRSNTIRSRFDTSVAYWRRLADEPIESQHARDGQPWQHGQVSVGQAVGDLYLNELDIKVGTVAGTDIGTAVQSLYLQGW